MVDYNTLVSTFVENSSVEEIVDKIQFDSTDFLSKKTLSYILNNAPIDGIRALLQSLDKETLKNILLNCANGHKKQHCPKRIHVDYNDFMLVVKATKKGVPTFIRKYLGIGENGKVPSLWQGRWAITRNRFLDDGRSDVFEGTETEFHKQVLSIKKKLKK